MTWQGSGATTDMTVRKSFTAITARPQKGELGLTEQKLFNYLFFRAYHELDRETVHRVPMRDVQEFLGNISTSKITGSIERLTSLDVKLDYMEENELCTVFGRFLSAKVTHSRNGYLWYAFDPLMRDFLAHPDVYGILYARTVEKFRSYYAARLYELLSAIRRRRYPVWEIDDIDTLRDYLGCANGQYPRFDNLRRQVIEKSIKEINEVAEFKASYELRRSGRGGRVVGLVFHVSERSPEEASSQTGGSAKSIASARDPKTIDMMDGWTDVERYGLPPLNQNTLQQARAMLDGREDALKEKLRTWYANNAGGHVRDADGEFLIWLTNNLAAQEGDTSPADKGDTAALEEATLTGLIDQFFENGNT